MQEAEWGEKTVCYRSDGGNIGGGGGRGQAEIKGVFACLPTIDGREGGYTAATRTQELQADQSLEELAIYSIPNSQIYPSFETRSSTRRLRVDPSHEKPRERPSSSRLMMRGSVEANTTDRSLQLLRRELVAEYSRE